MKVQEKRGLAAILLLLSALAFWGCQTTGGTKTSETIRWRTLNEGRVEAKERSLPCLVDFYFGPECHRCKQLDRNVYSNPYVIHRVNEEFVPVRIDLQKALSDEEQALMEKMETGGECMLLFLHPDGRVITDVSGVRVCTMGMITPEQFIEYLDRALNNAQRI